MGFSNKDLEQEIEYLQRLTARWFHGREAGLDLAQETLTRALAKRDQFVDDGEPKSLRRWLSTIARNYYNDRARKEIKEYNTVYMFPQITPPMQESLMRFKEMMVVWRQLPPRHRKVMVLLELGTLNYEEAARHTGLAIGTIKSIRSRARDRAAHLQGVSRDRLRGGNAV